MSRSFLIPSLAALLLAAPSAVAQRSDAEARRGDSDLRRSAVVRAVEQIGPSVVNVSAERFVGRRPSFFDDDFPGGRSGRSESLGSGVILDATGIVVTNDHVVSGASKIFVTTADGRELEADLLGADADNDLAVLKVDGKGLKPVRLGLASDLMIGETAIAVGNPFGLSNTVTTGIVSALHRTVKGEGRTYTDFIQTDAAINPGNSGGALCNVLGELIGINTAIVGGANTIGFAIPVERVRRITDDLLRFGEVKAVWIGLRGTTVTADRNRPSSRGLGMRVRSVYPASPAEGAGVEPGDLVVSLNGKPVESREDFDTLLAAVAPGSPVTLEIRKGEKGPERHDEGGPRPRGPRARDPPARDRHLGRPGARRPRRHLGGPAVARGPQGAREGRRAPRRERAPGRDARGRRARLRAGLWPLGPRTRRREGRLRLQPDVRPRLKRVGEARREPPRYLRRRSSETTIPRRTSPPPHHSRAERRSPSVAAAKSAVKTGSSAKMTAAWTAGIRACAHVWTRVVTTDATIPIQRTARRSFGVKTRGRPSAAKNASGRPRNGVRRSRGGEDPEEREDDLAGRVGPHVVPRRGDPQLHEDDRVDERREEDEEVARVETLRPRRPRHEAETRGREDEPREVRSRRDLPVEDPGRDGRQGHREARDEGRLRGRREELADELTADSDGEEDTDEGAVLHESRRRSPPSGEDDEGSPPRPPYRRARKRRGGRLLQDELVDDERRAPDRRHEDEGGVGEERLAARGRPERSRPAIIRVRRRPAVIIAGP